MKADFDAGSPAQCRAKAQELQGKARACGDPKLRSEYLIAIERLADLATALEGRRER